MNWSRRFDEPIKLPGGRMLQTLKDAGEHLEELPDTLLREKAAGNLMRAAKHHESGLMVWMARIAMMNAIYPEQPPIGNAKRVTKSQRWKTRRRLKRDSA